MPACIAARGVGAPSVFISPIYGHTRPRSASLSRDTGRSQRRDLWIWERVGRGPGTITNAFERHLDASSARNPTPAERSQQDGQDKQDGAGNYIDCPEAVALFLPIVEAIQCAARALPSSNTLTSPLAFRLAKAR